MTTCALVLAVIVCTATPDAPKRPTPAEAAAVLSASVPAYVAPVAPAPVAPLGWSPVYIPTMSGTTGALAPASGPWAMPDPAAARRLDGTRATDPPTLYGPGAFWLHYYGLYRGAR